MNFIAELLRRARPSDVAIVAIDAAGARTDWRFDEMIRGSEALAGAFANRGVGRGDVVMTLAANRIEWVLSLLACWRMGAVALPCSVQLREHDLEYRARLAHPKLCVGEEGLLSRLPDHVATMTTSEVMDTVRADRGEHRAVITEDLAPHDPALIVFTSGTTGEPRGIVHGQRYLEGQSLQAKHWFGARKGDLAWCTTATGWSKSARNVFLAPWLTGAAAVVHQARFDPQERLDLVEHLNVNVLCQAPTEYRMLVSRADLRPLPALRRMVSAGEALEPETIEVLRKSTGLEPADGYGQTETGQVAGNLVSEQVRQGSMGKVLPGIRVRIVDGEMQLHVASSPTFFSSYLDGRRFEGEWWSTGDLVREDEDGYLWFQGRDDDIILSAGYRIGPFEVESALVSHPAVAEAAAVASPDPERGSVVRAVVVLNEKHRASDALAVELQNYVKGQTAPYKYPRILEFVPELPKTMTGKTMRAALRRDPV